MSGAPRGILSNYNNTALKQSHKDKQNHQNAYIEEALSKMTRGEHVKYTSVFISTAFDC